MTPDPVTAALDKLAAQREQITQLDTREAGHHTAITGRLTEITGLITGITRTLHDHQAALARLEGLDGQAADAARPGGTASAGQDPDWYRPGPAPAWWKLTAAERQEPAARLLAWVEQVYRPGYGHLAVTLGPCWPAHDLCLYGLDILATLWSALYLQPSRSLVLLSGQAEYQARILPALATQLMTETTRCHHARTRSQAAPGQPRSMP
jgi:hypothetical protein